MLNKEIHKLGLKNMDLTRELNETKAKSAAQKHEPDERCKQLYRNYNPSKITETLPTSKLKAYSDCIKRIDLQNKEIKLFLENGKQKILNYLTTLPYLKNIKL